MDPSMGAVQKNVPHNKFRNEIKVFKGSAKVDGIATRYGVNVLGIEYRTGRGFPHPSRATFGPTQSPVQWVLDRFTGGVGGVKLPGVALINYPHLAPRFKKEYRYTSTPPLGLHGLSCGELYLILPFIQRVFNRSSRAC
jgi:hypothetical protein